MCKEMQFAINRQVVMDGLNRRAEERETAAREADLEAFEEDMIRRCNANCDEIHLQKRMDEEVRTSLEQCKAKISGRAYAKERRRNRRKDVALSCLIFFAFTVITFWLTTWTHLPLWGAITYIAGGAMFLALHLFMLHCEAMTEVRA